MTILSIGPSHTVAAALERSRASRPRPVFVGMQGSVYKGYDGGKPVPEYNVQMATFPRPRRPSPPPGGKRSSRRWTPAAAITLAGKRFQKLVDSKDPLVKALIENYRIWAKNDKVDASSILFDTVAVYLALPGPKPLLEMEELRIKVTDDGMTRDRSGRSEDVGGDRVEGSGGVSRICW